MAILEERQSVEVEARDVAVRLIGLRAVRRLERAGVRVGFELSPGYEIIEVPARSSRDRVFDVLSWLKRERAALIGGTGMIAAVGWAFGVLGIA